MNCKLYKTGRESSDHHWIAIRLHMQNWVCSANMKPWPMLMPSDNTHLRICTTEKTNTRLAHHNPLQCVRWMPYALFVHSSAPRRRCCRRRCRRQCSVLFSAVASYPTKPVWFSFCVCSWVFLRSLCSGFSCAFAAARLRTGSIICIWLNTHMLALASFRPIRMANRSRMMRDHPEMFRTYGQSGGWTAYVFVDWQKAFSSACSGGRIGRISHTHTHSHELTQRSAGWTFGWYDRRCRCRRHQQGHQTFKVNKVH